ncbi:hypothetical protein K469DRAFT_754194 [Zopfia rhizophila CBS 207.26]|uniref:SGNH hydrolase-type esterase domain-containing protein n=1 Tax=Zopfia rhizophila CBS 207.26 TaxID=1314779 RepID=A0A6A6DHG8_9PEZI|nr:hypothetical protein K469DRAFT_754194 [Zopfia rhizophila CBS 207.26]
MAHVRHSHAQEYRKTITYSCSGDKLNDIVGQIERVGDKKYEVATISIGGNDFFFGTVAKDCIYKIERGISEEEAQENCDVHLDNVDELLRRQVKVDEIWTRYADTLRNIYSKVLNNNGLLIVTGYPRFFSDITNVDNDPCENLRTHWSLGRWFSINSKIPLRRDNRNRINDQVKQVNDRIREDVLPSLNNPNIIFVDIDPLYEDHRFCEPVPDPLGANNPAVWFTELNTNLATNEEFNPGPSLSEQIKTWRDAISQPFKPSPLQMAATFHPKKGGNRKVAEAVIYHMLKWATPQTNDVVTWGPAEHEMGFSPGGGLTRFQIEQNCVMINPRDNTAPTVFCDDGAHRAKIVTS